MKHKGCYFEYEEARNRDLLRAYQRLQRTADLPRERIFDLLTQQPSARYWVSPERAYHVIRTMREGGSLPPMKPNKERMYAALSAVVDQILSSTPALSLYDAVAMAVEQPAPSFFLTAHTARKIIFRVFSGWYRQRKEQSIQMRRLSRSRGR